MGDAGLATARRFIDTDAAAALEGVVAVAHTALFCAPLATRAFSRNCASNPGAVPPLQPSTPTLHTTSNEAPRQPAGFQTKAPSPAGDEPAYRSDLEPKRPRDLDVTQAT
ncbi:hypothetical protein MRX96_027090 [Rhipicephalus microplus]